MEIKAAAAIFMSSDRSFAGGVKVDEGDADIILSAGGIWKKTHQHEYKNS